MRVCVAVVTANAPRSAAAVLASAMISGADEVMMINNGCSQEHLAYVHAACPTARHMDLTPAWGLAHCWNLALLHADADWVILSNDDVAFELGWRGMFEKAIAGGADEVYLAYPKNRFSCFALMPALVARMGWFDESFTGMFWEDDDWYLRGSEAGVVRAYVDGARHDGAARASERKANGWKPNLSKEPNTAAFQSKWEFVPEDTPGALKMKNTMGWVRRRHPELPIHTYWQCREAQL